MKKTYIYSIAAIVLLGACQETKPVEYNPTQPGDGTMTITAKLPAAIAADQTKVSLGVSSDAVRPAWQDSDALNINGKTFTIQPGYKLNTAQFKGEELKETSYNIVYPASFKSPAETEGLDFAGQKQVGNGNLDHIRYFAGLEGVDDCRNIEFTAEWAAAHGGVLHTISVLKFVVTLPETVTGVSSLSLDCGESEKYNLDLESCSIGSDHKLTAYFQMPYSNGLKFEENQKISFTAIDQDGEEVMKTFKPGPQELYPGRINEFVVGGDWPTSIKKGKGSMTDPYIITTVEEFNAIHGLLEGDVITCFRLDADLDMKDVTDWTPFNPNNLALGIYFDGNNHKISNFSCIGNIKWASMFGVLHGTIKDLTLVDPVVTNDNTSPSGILCAWVGNSDGSLQGTVENVHITGGKMTANNDTGYIGGMVGNCVSSTIGNCSFDGTVTRNGGTAGTYCCSGGLIGWTDMTNIIEGCSTSGTITTKNGRGTAGLIGYAKTNVDLKDCHSSMTVTAGNDCVGSLIGWCCGGSFSKCYATGNVNAGTQSSSSSASYCGGLVGHISTSATFADCWYKGNIVAKGNLAGGIVGQINAGTGDIRRCWFEGSIKCLSVGAGIVGRLKDKDNVIIEDCYSKGSISGTTYLSGICSDVYRNNIVRNCYTTVSIEGTYGLGGLIARCSNASAASVLMGGQNFNITVEKCIAWNPSVKTLTAGGENPVVHYPAGAVVGYTAEMNTLTDNYRNPSMDFNYFPEGEVTTSLGTFTYSGYNDLYDQDNTDASHPLYRKFNSASQDKYYFPYNGKAAPAGSTVSSVAKTLGWSETVWDLSGSEPALR